MDTTSLRAADGMAFVITLSSLVDWLPSIAALLSVIYTAIRIYESKTVQNMLNRKKTT